jgi:hypothetical protein
VTAAREICTPRPFDDAPVAGALHDAERAYHRLAAAVRAGDDRAWTAAGRAAVRSERQIRRSLGALRSA